MPKKEMPDHYRIKYRKNGTKEWKFGIQQTYSDEAKKFWKKGQLVIEDAVTPQSYAIDPKAYEIVDIKFGMGKVFNEAGDEYEEFVTAAYEEAKKTSAKAKGMVGKMFDVGVADGSASYVVTGETSRGYAVEWRGFCADRYVDHAYGWGGTFPKKMIKREVKCCEGMAKLFA